MASTLQRPSRNTRKRKRVDDDINMNHESKRRKKIEKWSERTAQGFCNYCTNPYKLITCKQCYRSWHLNCFKKYILNNNIPNNDEIPLKPITNNVINNNNHSFICNEKNITENMNG